MEDEIKNLYLTGCGDGINGYLTVDDTGQIRLQFKNGNWEYFHDGDEITTLAVLPCSRWSWDKHDQDYKDLDSGAIGWVEFCEIIGEPDPIEAILALIESLEETK